MQGEAKSKDLIAGVSKSLVVKWRQQLIFVAAVVFVAMTLVGIFMLATWAEVSAWHHAVQHVVIFVSGAGFGGSLLAGYSDRKVKSDES